MLFKRENHLNYDSDDQAASSSSSQSHLFAVIILIVDKLEMIAWIDSL